MESVEDSDFGKTADKEIQKTVQSEFVASPTNAAKIGSAGIEGNNAAFSSQTLAQKAEQRVSRHRRYAENKDVRKEHSVMPRETGVLSEKKDDGVRTSEGGGIDTVSLGKQGSAVEDVSFGGASGPAFRRFVQPDYPLRARRTGVSGKVLLQVLLDEHGRVLEIKTLSGNDMLVESAVAAIRKSSFFPLMKNSKPVPCQTVIPIRFTLE
jgi:protein TonB